MRHLFRNTVILACLAFMAVAVCAAEDREGLFDPSAECSAVNPDAVPSTEVWAAPSPCEGLSRDAVFRSVERCRYDASAVVASGTARVVLTKSEQQVGATLETFTTGTLTDASGKFLAAGVGKGDRVLLREGTLLQENLAVAGTVSDGELTFSGGSTPGDAVPYVVVRECEATWAIAAYCSAAKYVWENSDLAADTGDKAAARCKALSDANHDGRSNWRVPSQSELQSLVLDCAVEGCRMKAGLEGECTYYWASDLQDPEDPAHSNQAFVDMKGGGAGYDGVAHDHLIRCIAEL